MLRHEADYNWNHILSRADVLLSIEGAEQLIAQFRSLGRSDPEVKFFLAKVTVWSRLP